MTHQEIFEVHGFKVVQYGPECGPWSFEVDGVPVKGEDAEALAEALMYGDEEMKHEALETVKAQ